MGRSKCFLTYSCPALAVRDVFAKFVALLTRNAVAKRCVFADVYICFIYNTLCNRLKLAGSSHILTKFMDAQRHTALIFVTQGVGCSLYMCDCMGYKWSALFCETILGLALQAQQLGEKIVCAEFGNSNIPIVTCTNQWYCTSSER